MIGSPAISFPPSEIASVASSLPPPVPQSAVAEFTVALFPRLDRSRALQVFENASIEHRHLARPLDWYAEPQPPSVRFRLAADLALEHGSFAARQALARAAVEPGEVDSLVFASTTVLRSPNLDVSLASTLGLRHDVRRLPLFGLASLGGAAALGTAADLVRSGDRVVLVVACEMNSLTVVPEDESMESVVTMALFSDGAAAAVVRAGADRADADGVRVVGRHSTLVPDSLDVMGFDATDEGLRWRLAPDVPEVARRWVRVTVEEALATVGWTLDDVEHALVHPGGSKVLDAVEEALGGAPGRLRRSREAMRAHGNVSSATVLLVLEDFLADRPTPGRGILTAMGPGFAFEHVLFAVGPGFADAG